MIFDLQKASIWKRISAFLFDFIVFGIVAVGAAFLISLIVGYTSYLDELKSMAMPNGMTVEQALTEGTKMAEAELAELEAVFVEFIKTSERATYLYSMIVNLTLLIVSLGILASFLITEFTVPLLFKNGQTLGKKIFGICLMRVDGVKVTPVMMFVRTLLGKYTIETMIPLIILIMMLLGTIGIVGPIIILLISILQLAMFITSKNRSLIHDILSKTVAVDYASQMIFDTEEEMIAYKKKVHAEMAERSPY